MAEDLDSRVAYCQRRIRELDTQFEELVELQQRNGEQLQELIRLVGELSKNTEGVVSAYNNIRGAVRVGVALQDICIWLGKWGVVGTAAAYALKWVLDHSPSN